MCWQSELGSAGQFFNCPLGLFLCLWSVVCQLCWSWLGCLTYLELIWDDPSLFCFVFFVVSLGFVHVVEARGPVHKQKQIESLRCKFGSGTTLLLLCLLVQSKSQNQREWRGGEPNPTSFFFNFNFFFILLYNSVLVLPCIDMNAPQVYMRSQTWTPPPTSLPITSLWVIPMHQPQACCILRQTLLLSWSS